MVVEGVFIIIVFKDIGLFFVIFNVVLWIVGGYGIFGVYVRVVVYFNKIE